MVAGEHHFLFCSLSPLETRSSTPCQRTALESTAAGTAMDVRSSGVAYLPVRKHHGNTGWAPGVLPSDPRYADREQGFSLSMPLACLAM